MIFSLPRTHDKTCATLLLSSLLFFLNMKSMKFIPHCTTIYTQEGMHRKYTFYNKINSPNTIPITNQVKPTLNISLSQYIGAFLKYSSEAS